MQINHNIPALRALNSLNKTNTVADKHMRNLSSGLRINSAADDAAGMAISNKMRTQVKGLKRASMNAEDGISLVQTAEGALSEVHSMLQRMRELAVQGANGTLKTEDRRAIQMEVEQLKQEITSTANLTEFNKVTLLDGQLDKRSFTDNNIAAESAYVSDTVEAGEYKFDVNTLGTKATKTMTAAMGLSGTATITGTQTGIININGEEVKITEGMTKEQVFAAIRDLAETVDLTLTKDASDKLTLTSNEAGSKQKITIFSNNGNLLTAAGLDPIPEASAVTGTDAKITLDSTSSFGSTATATVRGNRVEITDANYKKIIVDVKAKTGAASVAPSPITLGGLTFTFNAAVGANYNDYTVKFEESANATTTPVVDSSAKTITLKYANGAAITSLTGTTIAAQLSTAVGSTVTPSATTAYAGAATTAKITGGVAKGPVTLNVLDAGPLQLQVGANEGMKIEVQIPELTATALGLEFINLRTSEGAGEAITLCDKAIAEISAVRSKLGAYQNRLEYTINNLNATEENTTAALSRIEDADMASEMAEYTQKNVISQAGMSMLTKANQRPEQVLQLLQ